VTVRAVAAEARGVTKSAAAPTAAATATFNAHPPVDTLIPR
jgi:hypothetical protein